MSERVHIRVTISDDGKTPKHELMLDGVKIADMSWLEVLQAAMQFISALRWR